MLDEPLVTLGLADAGAHVGQILDASQPTFFLVVLDPRAAAVEPGGGHSPADQRHRRSVRALPIAAGWQRVVSPT